MPVTVDFQELDSLLAFPRVAITEQWAVRVMATLNALYEVIFDKQAATGGQVYAGHNHGVGGGAPIIRNAIMCMDRGTAPLFTLTSTTANPTNSHVLMPYYVSPNIATQGQIVYALCAICYKATGDDFTVGFDVLEDVARIERPSESTELNKPEWGYFPVKLLRDTVWERKRFYATSVGGGAASLDIHAIHLFETYNDSQPILGLRPAPPNLTHNQETIIRFFYVLDEVLAIAEEWGDSLLFGRLYANANALVESILDQSAYGVAPANQAYSGHDHTKTPADSQGGRAVTRGLVFSAGGSNNSLLWYSTTGTVNTWNYADASNIPRRTTAGSAPGGTVTTDPIFKGWVTEEFTSTGNPPTTAPYLTGEIMLKTNNGAASVEVRIFNITTGTHSAVLTIPTSPTAPTAWFSLDKIPCAGGQINDFVVEVRSTSHATLGVDIHGITIGEHELAHDNTTPAAQIASAGTSIIGKPNEGTTRQQGVIRRPAS